jgi:mannitol-1-/sugar-/sorbitol-6-phosphatase
MLHSISTIFSPFARNDIQLVISKHDTLHYVVPSHVREDRSALEGFAHLPPGDVGGDTVTEAPGAREYAMDYLFDMDGVLVDSKSAWFRSFSEAGGVSRKEFEETFWGRELQANIRELGITKEYLCDSVLSKYLDAIALIPGAREVLSSIRGRKALITNTTSRCTDRILGEHGLLGYFDAIVTGDEVEKGKPDPAIIRLALERIGASPESTVVIGDAESDVQAGRAAGCITVGIGVEGDYTADTLRDLPEIIKRLERERDDS